MTTMRETIPSGIKWWTEEALYERRKYWRHVVDVTDQDGYSFERRIFTTAVQATAWAESWGPLPISYPFGPLRD